jgi:hydrolase, TatD family
MIIDSHCHLDNEKLQPRIKEIIEIADKSNVKYMLTICTNNESFVKIIDILQTYKNIFGTYGIHPHEANKYKNISADIISEQLLKNKKIIGVGESGLDFYYNHSEASTQKKVFLKHIEASQATSKPLIVHTRNAEKDTLEIISSEKKNKNFDVLMHCFTGSKEFAHSLIDIDCYFSASGVITFKKSIELAKTFKSIPNDKILVETDSPYLSPEPLRGKINVPSNIVHTVKFISKLKETTNEDVEKFTTNNFLQFFKINIA